MGCGRVRRSTRLAVAVCGAVIIGLIQAGPLTASAAAARPRARAATCSTDVAAGLWQITSNGCLNQVAPGHWTTTDAVTLNGVPLVPAPGTSLDLVQNSPEGAAVLSVNASVSVAGVTFEKEGLLRLDLPAGRPGEEATVFSTGALNGEKLFGFPISGSFEIDLGEDAANVRYAKFIGNLELPSVFKNGPQAGAGGLTATVGLRVDRNGVHADAVKAQVSNAYIGSLQVKNLCLSFVSAGSVISPCSPPVFGAEPFLQCQSPGNVDRWDGSADIVIPTADHPEVGVWAGVEDGQFSYAGGQVTHLGNAVPIAPEVYLDRVALAVCVHPPPVVFKGAAGINIGPTVNGVAPVSLAASVQYTDSRPWVLEASGSLDVFGYHVADGFIRYRSDNTIDFGFNANLDFKVASLEAHLAGWIEARKPLRFNVDGSGKVCVLSVACLSGEVTASSEGLAGCITVMEGDIWELVKDSDWDWLHFWRTHWELHHWRVRAGLGVHWGGSVNLMGDSCDVGPYRAARSARVSAAGVYTIRVGSGMTALALKAQGAKKAPGVELIAPNGQTYTSPRVAAKIVPGHDLFVEDPQTDATQVMIARPVAGVWRLRALGGSRITRIEQASVDPMPTVQAGVGGSGEQRILGYSYQPQAMHTTRFVEEGGKYEQELGVAKGGPCKGERDIHPNPAVCGQLRFTPAPGPAGVRHIYAVTTMNGEETRRELVATYDAPSEPEPTEVPHEMVKRLPDALSISWAGSGAKIRAAMPVDYDVDVNLTDGRRLLFVLRRGMDHVTIPGVGTHVGARVMISPVREDETLGKTRAVTLTVAAAQASS